MAPTGAVLSALRRVRPGPLALGRYDATGPAGAQDSGEAIQEMPLHASAGATFRRNFSVASRHLCHLPA